MLRLHAVSRHLSAGRSEPSVRLQPCSAAARPDDVVVVHGLRTPIGRAKKGSFKRELAYLDGTFAVGYMMDAWERWRVMCLAKLSVEALVYRKIGKTKAAVKGPLKLLDMIEAVGRTDTTPDELLSAAMSAVLKDVGLSPDKVGDTCVGNVLQPGAGALVARIAQFLSGFPDTVPVHTVNRQCSSGLQALFNIAGGIRNGSFDLGLACGVESMTLRAVGNPGDVSSRLMDNEKARDCIIPMGITSENVAERFGISREKQDFFAFTSQQRAAQAQKQGLFEQEIVPVTTKFVDENGTERTITVTKDDGIRPGTTMEGLAKLRPAFKENGSTTAGNASQVSDGAAAVLVGRRSTVEALGLPVLGILRGSAVVGVPPDVMGIGPAYAIPEALKQAGLTIDDIDVFEINEAFASQAVYCVEKLGIPLRKVNPNGGAIALGHPLGCTGARQVVTLLNELKRRRKRSYGVVSMCIGTGMGAAAVFEYPGQ